MKATNRHNILLGAALLGIGTTFGGLISAQAAPRDNETRQERREVKRARREVKEERRDVRRADSPAERRQEQQDLNRARRDLRENRQDLRQDRNRNNVGNRTYNNRRNANNRPYRNNRPNVGNRSDYNNGYNNGGRSYTGTVTRVRSNQSFDINIGGNTFNVYLNSYAPRGLSEGDQVRVNGVQQYNNDIRNASVSVIRNR